MVIRKFLFFIKKSLYKILLKSYQVKIMLLIGINTNLITYPTIPITPNPNAHDDAIFINSKCH